MSPSPIDTSTLPEERLQRRLRDLEQARWNTAVPVIVGSGEAGPEGPPGTQIYSGSGAPSGGLGGNGDFYVRTDTGDLYKKAGGSWSILVSLIGPEGPAGENGAYVVHHGSNPLTARPEGASVVIWVGTATPANAEGDDLWFNPAALGETEYTNYGIVEALPATEHKGDRCMYKWGTGRYWELVYTAEATYPWAKVGGPPQYSQYVGAEFLATSSETPQTTNAPSVTVPLKMEAMVEWGANLVYATAITQQARMGLYVDAVFTSFYTSTGFSTNGSIAPDHGRQVAEVASGKVVQPRYWRSGGAGEVQFYAPYVQVDPIRVG